MNFLPLNAQLVHLQPYLEDEGVSEVSVNRPGELWVEQNGQTRREEVTVLTMDFLLRMARLIADATHQVVNEKTPLLSATLPQGHRIQCVIPPACPSDRVILSIRRQAVMELSLQDYEDRGFFKSPLTSEDAPLNNAALLELLENKRHRDFLTAAVKAKKTLLISGGCSTGKTTLLNTLMAMVGSEERIITIEDAPEVRLKQPNHVSLLYSRNNQGIAQVSPQMLVETSLRLRPDRIIMSELRGAEAYYFLRAANTGHEGSMSTLHADSPLMAIKQLSFMCMQSGMPITHAELNDYISSAVDVIIQIGCRNDQRYLSDIWFQKERQWIA